MKATTLKNWPHPDYPNAWMAFRRASRENTVIANWITLQSSWPKTTPLKLTDIGCGDGKVIAEVINRSISAGRKVGSVLLIDPHRPSLDAAAEDVQQIAAIQPEKFEGGLKDALNKIPTKIFAADAILFIHVVYLMENSEFDNLLERLPRGVPLYVAFDEPNSVFSLLWKKSGAEPPFLSRVIEAHNTINLLPRDKYNVSKTKLVSEFDRNLIEPGKPQASILVSMLCYNDKVDISPNTEFGKYFSKVVDDNTKAGKVQCQFAGYEIVKK